MKTIFITGGYGFLGQFLVQAAHEADGQARLRVLVRRERETFLDLRRLERVSWVRGELSRPESFVQHLEGMDTVIHNAALVSFDARRREEVFEANVVGTHNLAQAALAAGCQNFIFISSISALDFRAGEGRPGAAGYDETAIPDLEVKRKYDMYGYSKRVSEIELYELRERMRVVMLNPSVILGPGSERVEAVMRMVRRAPVIPMMDYVNAFVDVRDVAQAAMLALSKGRSGERYIVSAHNARMIEFTRLIVQALGKRTPVVRLSPLGLRLADGFFSVLDALKLNPGVRRPSQMSIDKPCSSEKIRAEMGWQPEFSLEQSVVDAVEAIGR